MNRTDPDLFKVTEYLRNYCIERNWPTMLPNVYLHEFIQNCKDRVEQKRPPKWTNAELAFRNWIRNSSPGHCFYHASEWESKLAAAKALESPPRKRIIPAYDPRGAQLDAGQIKTAYEIAQARLREVREKAGI